MKRQDKEEKQMDRKKPLDSLCSTTGLLLSVVCCITLIHVELRMQEHHCCDQMETESFEKYNSITDDGKIRRAAIQKVTGRR